MNTTDRINVRPAVVQGDYRIMSRVAISQRAIISALRDESVNLTDFHRSGLMLALDELVSVLEGRAGYLEDEGFVDGGEL